MAAVIVIGALFASLILAAVISVVVDG